MGKNKKIKKMSNLQSRKKWNLTFIKQKIMDPILNQPDWYIVVIIVSSQRGEEFNFFPRFYDSRMVCPSVFFEIF